MVNNLGGTPTMELAIVARRAMAGLEGRGLVVERAYGGTFLSALEMAGVSLSVLQRGRRDGSRGSTRRPTAPAWPNAAAEDQDSRQGRWPEASAEADEPLPGAAAVARSGRRLERGDPAVAPALIAEAPRLTALDRAVGDGDLGISLSAGRGRP